MTAYRIVAISSFAWGAALAFTVYQYDAKVAHWKAKAAICNSDLTVSHTEPAGKYQVICQPLEVEPSSSAMTGKPGVMSSGTITIPRGGSGTGTMDNEWLGGGRFPWEISPPMEERP